MKTPDVDRSHEDADLSMLSMTSHSKKNQQVLEHAANNKNLKTYLFSIKF